VKTENTTEKELCSLKGKKVGEMKHLSNQQRKTKKDAVSIGERKWQRIGGIGTMVKKGRKNVK